MSGFSKLADTELDDKAMSIYAALLSNANFPTPADLKGLIVTYQQALATPPGQPRERLLGTNPRRRHLWPRLLERSRHVPTARGRLLRRHLAKQSANQIVRTGSLLRAFI